MNMIKEIKIIEVREEQKIIIKRKNVPLSHWEAGIYTGWDVYAYSEYDKIGVPKYAEIQREFKRED